MDPTQTDASDTLAFPLQADEVTRIASAFYELDEAHRVVLCLHYLEQLTMEEIALVLDDESERVAAVYREGLELLSRDPRRRDAA